MIKENKNKKNKMEEVKILATIGPSSLKKTIIQEMDKFGVDIFRINLSHTKISDLEGIIKKIKKWTGKTICLDTEGAQIRTGKFKNGEEIMKDNSNVLLVNPDVLGDKSNIPLYPIKPENTLRLGDVLFMDFNSAIVQVVEVKDGKVQGRVISGGKIGSNKGVSADRNIHLSPFTEKDLKAFKIAEKNKISCFAFSFAARKKDIEFLKKLFPYPISIISKIETKTAIKNLEEICSASDAVLIDRGDLSREVPLTKISLAQKNIIDTAKKLKTPVYVATNLLESMITQFKPTRGEINDITSTLLQGGNGLVLAAETAVGEYPIEAVKMACEIKKEVENYRKGKDNFFESVYDYFLIPPHGGVLTQNYIGSEKIKHIGKLPKLSVDRKIISDIVQITEGVYSPIRGFMGRKELMSVLDDYKLLNGAVWTMPILLQLDKKEINFSEKDAIVFQRKKDNKNFALMKVSGIEKINKKQIAKKWFGTDDLNHPGVAYFMGKGEYIVSGEVFLLEKPAECLYSYSLTPQQTRRIFKEKGWTKIVGFHTRNVIHRGHEFIQKQALKKINADALFISPVVGSKKPTDFSKEAILGAYEIMLKNKYYHPYPALLGTFNTYSRYSGPREAVFTALCRKNFGCSHFIIGRDHTGVGDYYSPGASHKIFEKIGNIGIIPLFFNEAYFCRKCNQVTDKCGHSQKWRINISGTEIRKRLLENKKMPEYLLRKDVTKILRNMYKISPSSIFEGKIKNK